MIFKLEFLKNQPKIQMLPINLCRNTYKKTKST